MTRRELGGGGIGGNGGGGGASQLVSETQDISWLAGWRAGRLRQWAGDLVRTLLPPHPVLSPTLASCHGHLLLSWARPGEQETWGASAGCWGVLS